MSTFVGDKPEGQPAPTFRYLDENKPTAYDNMAYTSEPPDRWGGPESRGRPRDRDSRTSENSNGRKRCCIVCVAVFFSFIIGAAIGAGVCYAVVRDTEDSSSVTTTTAPTIPPRADNAQMIANPDFEGSFSLLTEAWNPALSDVNSEAFRRKASETERMVDRIYQASDVRSVVDYAAVTGFRQGSLVVLFGLWMTDEPGQQDLVASLLSQPQQLIDAFLQGRDNLVAAGSDISDEISAISITSLTLTVASTTPATTTAAAPTTTPPMPATTTTTTIESATTRMMTTTAIPTTTTTPTTTTATTMAEQTTTEPPEQAVRCGEVRTQPDFRIVGGEATGHGVFPWMVLVVGDYLCGGSIIDPSHVLSAAHCFDMVDGRVNYTEVVAGRHETRRNQPQEPEHVQRVEVDRVYLHKDYNKPTPDGEGSFLNDIAVLRLVRPLTFNSRVAPVCLPDEDDTLPPSCIVSGWGYHTYPHTSLPETLREVTMQTYDHEECLEKYGETFFFEYPEYDIQHYLSEEVICAANDTHGGLDSCQGDSGGPLFCLQDDGQRQRYSQFGIVSWGVGCGLPGKPGVYTYVPHFRRWLQHTALPKLEFLTTVDDMLCFNETRCGRLLMNVTDASGSQLCSMVSATLACMLTAPQTDRCSRQVGLTELRQYLTYLDILDMDDSHNITHCLESLESEDGEVDVCEDTTLQVYLATSQCQAADTSLSVDHLCLRVLPSAPQCVSRVLSQTVHHNCSVEDIETALYSSHFYQSNYGSLCADVCEGFMPDKCLDFFVSLSWNSSESLSPQANCRLLYQSIKCVEMKHELKEKRCTGERLRESVARSLNADRIGPLLEQCDEHHSALQDEAVYCENPELLTWMATHFCLGDGDSQENVSCRHLPNVTRCVVDMLTRSSVHCPRHQVHRLIGQQSGCPAPDVDSEAEQGSKTCSGQAAVDDIRELALRHCDVVLNVLLTFSDSSAIGCGELRRLLFCVSKVANYNGYSCSQLDISNMATSLLPSSYAFLVTLVPQCTGLSPDTEVTGVEEGGVCVDSGMIRLYTTYSCYGAVDRVSEADHRHFCLALETAVRCANISLLAYGHHCSLQQLASTIYGMFTPPLYYMMSYDQCDADHSPSAPPGQDECVYASLWSSHVKTCHAMMHQLAFQQCQNLEQSLQCLQTEMAKHGRYCDRRDLYRNVVNTLASFLGHAQRTACDELDLSMPEARCQDNTLLPLAVAHCSNDDACISWLELSLCVQRLLDPRWLDCSRYDTEYMIMALGGTNINTCQDYSVRLVGNGRGFMYLGREWLILCGDHWGDSEANVTCTQLGYSAGLSSIVPWTRKGLYLTPDVHATGWMHATCSGSENSLADCQLDRQTPCSKTFIASAICYETVPTYELQPTNPSDDYGYVQLTRDEGQGLVCVQHLTDHSAHLLCREAGYVAGMTFSRPLTPASPGPVWAAELNCSKEAVDINGCMGGEWTLLQQAPDWCQPARVFCFPSEVRFHNGLFNSSGLVQMYRPANRGRDVILRSVCRDCYTEVMANITCRELGFPLGGQVVPFNPFYVPRLDGVRLRCTGDEARLSQCQIEEVPDTVCPELAVARCTPNTVTTEPELSVKLDPVDNGQVLVYTDGQWGTVCADHWTSAEATAVCRQLGFLRGYGIRARMMARSYPHVLHEVDCQDNATSLADCSFQPVQSDICRNVRPAAVICTNQSLPEFSLQGEERPNAGPIYVSQFNTTAPVRARLPQSVAHVFCQSLGYLTGDVDRHGEMVSDVTRHMTSFWWGAFTNCTARAMGLEECLMSGLELLSCSQGDSNPDPRCSEPLASVFCYETGARLHSGFTSKAGIVQLYRNGDWWEICEDDITGSCHVRSAGNIICRDVMGSSEAEAIVLEDSEKFYGIVKTSPVRARVRVNVTCNANVTDVTSASSIEVMTSEPCPYGDTEAFAVVCYEGDRPSSRFGEFRVDEEGVVLVERYGVWGTVCASMYHRDHMRLLCQHLGYDDGEYMPKENTPARPVWINYIDCSYDSWSYCFFNPAEDFAPCTDEITGVYCYSGNMTTPMPTTPPTTPFPDIPPGPGGDTCGEVRFRLPMPRIIGGTPATPGDFPWQVMMLRGGRFACGGTIIDEFHVVTAAHCLDDLTLGPGGLINDVSSIDLLMGKHRFSLDTTYLSEQRVKVMAGVIHPAYLANDITYGYDIAVLRLETTLSFNDRVSALCMPDAITELPDRCVLSGWGDTSGFGSSPDELMRVVLPVFTQEECSSEYPNFSDMPTSAVCTINSTHGGVGACYGDSGGPLACMQPEGRAYQLIGVVSYGSRGCITENPTVYTYVPYFRSWVLQSALAMSDEDVRSRTCFSPFVGNFSASLQCLSVVPSVSGLNTTQTCRLYKQALECVRKAGNSSCSYQEIQSDIQDLLVAMTSDAMAAWYSQEAMQINRTVSLCQADALAPSLEIYTDVCEEEDVVLSLASSDLCYKNGTFDESDTELNVCQEILPDLMECVHDTVTGKLLSDCDVEQLETSLKGASDELPQRLGLALDFEQCEDQCLGFTLAVSDPNTCLPLLEQATSSSFTEEEQCQFQEETVRCARANIQREGYDCEGQVLDTLGVYVNSADLEDLLPYSNCTAMYPNLTTDAAACENPALLGSLLRVCDSRAEPFSASEYPCSYVSDSVECIVGKLAAGGVYCIERRVRDQLIEHNAEFNSTAHECGITDDMEPELSLPQGGCAGAGMESTLQQLASDHCAFLLNRVEYASEPAHICMELEDLVRCVTLASNHAGLACSAADVMSLVNWTAQYPNVTCPVSQDSSVSLVAGSVCDDRSTVQFYTQQLCSAALDQAIHSKDKFCKGFESAVVCARTALHLYYGQDCPHLDPIVYDLLTPSVYYVGSPDTCDNLMTGTSVCRYFAPWDTALDTCHTIFQRLWTSPTCSDFTEAVNCVQTTFMSSSRYCGRYAIAERLGETVASELRVTQCYADWPYFPEVCSDERILRTLVGLCSNKNCRLCCRPISDMASCVLDYLAEPSQSCDLKQSLGELYFQPGVICQESEPVLDEAGRVYIYYHDVYYGIYELRPMCGDLWTEPEAMAVCRQGGYIKGAPSNRLITEDSMYYGSSYSSSWLPYYVCVGGEDALGQCWRGSSRACSRFHAAVVCYDQVYEYKLMPAETNGTTGSIQLNGDDGMGDVCVTSAVSDVDARVMCKEAGYVWGVVDSQENSTAGQAVWRLTMECQPDMPDVAACLHKPFLEYATDPTDSCQVPVVKCYDTKGHLSRPGENLGIASLYDYVPLAFDYNSFPICRDGFTDTEASVLCREVGYDRGGVSLPFNPFYPVMGRYFGVNCTGTEVVLEDCDVMPNVTSCSEPAVVQCTKDPAVPDPAVDLKLASDGRHVLVYRDGQWGTVCADRWTEDEATVVCHQLFDNTTAGLAWAMEGEPRTWPHVVRNVTCTGSEDDWSQCQADPVDTSDCVDKPAAAVYCLDKEYRYSLVGGDADNYGYIMISEVTPGSSSGSEYLLVADLTDVLYNALCHQLGYLGGREFRDDFPLSYNFSSADTWTADYDDNCFGLEPSVLDQCRVSEWTMGSCSQAPEPCTSLGNKVYCYDSPVRFHTGPSFNLGVPLFYDDGDWSAICAEDVDSNTTEVICRQALNSSSASGVTWDHDDFYVTYPDKVVRANVTCTSEDVVATDCISLLDDTSCTNSGPPAAMMCYDGEMPDGNVTDWRKAADNRVEVKRYMGWGTVCDDTWYTGEADRLCKKLGYVGGTYGPGLDRKPKIPMWVMAVDCSGADTFDDCTVELNGEDAGACFTGDDATLLCN